MKKLQLIVWTKKLNGRRRYIYPFIYPGTSLVTVLGIRWISYNHSSRFVEMLICHFDNGIFAWVDLLIDKINHSVAHEFYNCI